MGIIFETPLIVRREDSRGNGKNKSRKTIDTEGLRCYQRFQPFLQFCEVYFCHRCWLKVFKSTQYKALYVNILCQAFPQETRSHMIYHVIKEDWGCFPNKRADGDYWPSAHCLPILNKPADAGVLPRVNSPVNCKEAVHTARITEGVEKHGLGVVPETAGSRHGAAVIFPAYKEGVRTRSKKLSGVQRQSCSRIDRGRRSELRNHRTVYKQRKK